KPIEIDGGLYKISCSGAMSLALGSAEGKAAVHMSNCGMKIHAASANFVGVGSFGGDAEVRVADVKLEIDAGGNTMCGLGSKDGGRADIKIRNCEFASRFKGRNIINIGSYGSETVCGIEHSSVNIYSEGGTVSGIGDSCGGGRVDVKDTEVKLSFMTGNGFALGCRDGEMTFVGGSKKIGINE
ncbi:MAG: EAL domain-containing protein, partial [Ruminococcus sp.]|nr:EAL domain-containing protein [Ruminococcus sp.]